MVPGALLVPYERTLGIATHVHIVDSISIDYRLVRCNCTYDGKNHSFSLNVYEDQDNVMAPDQPLPPINISHRASRLPIMRFHIIQT